MSMASRNQGGSSQVRVRSAVRQRLTSLFFCALSLQYFEHYFICAYKVFLNFCLIFDIFQDVPDIMASSSSTPKVPDPVSKCFVGVPLSSPPQRNLTTVFDGALEDANDHDMTCLPQLIHQRLRVTALFNADTL